MAVRALKVHENNSMSQFFRVTEAKVIARQIGSEKGVETSLSSISDNRLWTCPDFGVLRSCEVCWPDLTNRANSLCRRRM